MFDNERVAAEVIGRVRGGTIYPPTGNHDADLRLTDGRTIGLEVTRAIDTAEATTWAAIGQRRVGNYPRLARWWNVGLHAGASVKRAHAVVPELLVRLETLGEVGHRWLKRPAELPGDDLAVAEIEVALDDAGVDHAGSWVPKPGASGGYSFVAHKDGGAIDGQDVIDAVMAEVQKADNLKKLNDMPTDEQHLFVWIDHSRTAASAALRSGFSALPTPVLPDVITTLWIAAHTSTHDVLWFADGVHSITPPGAWIPHS